MLSLLPIVEVAPAHPAGDGWLSQVLLREGEEELRLQVAVSDTQRCIAGLREPTRAWLEERTQWWGNQWIRNGRPVLEQVREWPQPLYLHAELP